VFLVTLPLFPCVALVPSGAVLDPGFEEALQELNRRGYQIRRARPANPPPGLRDRLVTGALDAGFSELLLLDPAVVFDPADVDKLRGLNLPFSCGVYPWPGRQGLACAFQPGTTTVRFGLSGGPLSILSCGLGFALVRRVVFDAIAAASPAGTPVSYFRTEDPGATQAVEDVVFCERAKAKGFEVIADTSIRLWRVGPARLGWEDAAGDRPRLPDFNLRIAGSVQPTAESVSSASTTAAAHPQPTQPLRSPLRPPAKPLTAGFPRLGMYIGTYPANAMSLQATLESVRASDWGAEPEVVLQPEDWPLSRESGSATYKRGLEAAWADGCDFAVILEDDVRVSKNLKASILANPLVARDQCDYLGLFLPDTIADPWNVPEPHLGYRLARPRFMGANRLWTRTRVWGSQALVLSRRLVRAAIDTWDRFTEGQDSRMMGVCSEFGVPLWYSLPCLAEHAPVKSAYNTPDAYAPDFDPDAKLVLQDGFHPPEGIPGAPKRAEAELLWKTAKGLEVLELGTGCGRSTVSLAQSALRVVTVDIADQAEAVEWVRRFGLSARVEFVRGEAATVCQGLPGPFDLAFVDTGHDEVSLTRDIDAALKVLKQGGTLAFHNYPDPEWPDMRRIVDQYARRLGWRRIAQTGFLGVFRT